VRTISPLKVGAALLVLSAAAIAFHGYHPYAEDAEICLPGVEKALQPTLFPASTGPFEYANASIFHVEWPWARPRNEWAEAFVWIRQNTPTDSIFAIDPYYMNIAGEDAIGFRALAQRSRLADAIKDRGSASMFPALAENWYEQRHAIRN